jgi:hypothetical protein
MAKTTTCHVATRKGLFTITRGAAAWSVSRVSFLGDNCTLAVHGETDRLDVAPDMGDCAGWKRSFGGALVRHDAGRTVQIRRQRRFVGILNRPLWDDPLRERWSGGGAEYPGIHSICVNPRDPDDVVIGVSTGGAWTTRDGGRSWRIGGKGMRAEYMPPKQQFEPNAQDAHLVVQCTATPASLWVQHHNGIFRSTDRAASWSEIAHVHPSAFGFAVAVHPLEPDTAWFVPAVKDEKRYPANGRVVVNRTRDGGRTFEILTHGLPQEHAYDLVYRHALDVDDTGEVLAFGSTTRSLWLSEDGGDAWQMVSSHLPPIHSVRFEINR